MIVSGPVIIGIPTINKQTFSGFRANAGILWDTRKTLNANFKQSLSTKFQMLRKSKESFFFQKDKVAVRVLDTVVLTARLINSSQTSIKNRFIYKTNNRNNRLQLKYHWIFYKKLPGFTAFSNIVVEHT